MDYVLRTFDLCKKYKNQLALNQACLNIERGDIYGFVGENGSGKTTIIRTVTGLIFADSGSYEIFGIPSDSPEITSARKKVGAIVESPSIYLNMTAMDNLLTQCGILGISDKAKAEAALFEVGLGELSDSKKKAGNFSLGMRQRLGIAMALLGDPEFIILDEPMNGLDPAGIVEIRELILKLNQERGITFLISSHILTELALVATKYGIISKGRVVREITAEELKRECRRITTIRADKPEELWAVLSELFAEEDLRRTQSGATVLGDVSLNQLLSKIIDADIQILSIVCTEASIEDFYLSVVGGAHHG